MAIIQRHLLQEQEESTEPMTIGGHFQRCYW